jgi:hypothetical protein
MSHPVCPEGTVIFILEQFPDPLANRWDFGSDILAEMTPQGVENPEKPL